MHQAGVKSGSYFFDFCCCAALSFDDVVHYQKIVKILTETDRVMKEIKLPLSRATKPLPHKPPQSRTPSHNTPYRLSAMLEGAGRPC